MTACVELITDGQIEIQISKRRNNIYPVPEQECVCKITAFTLFYTLSLMPSRFDIRCAHFSFLHLSPFRHSLHLSVSEFSYPWIWFLCRCLSPLPLDSSASLFSSLSHSCLFLLSFFFSSFWFQCFPLIPLFLSRLLSLRAPNSPRHLTSWWLESVFVNAPYLWFVFSVLHDRLISFS